MLRDERTTAPPGSVHFVVLLQVWGNATHGSGRTHGTLGSVRSRHSDGLPLAVEALMRGCTHVQNQEQFIGHAAARYTHVTVSIDKRAGQS